MLCVTGLPLILREEIDAAMGVEPEWVLSGTFSAHGGLPLDVMLNETFDERSGEIPLLVASSQDGVLLTVITGLTPDAVGEHTTLLFLDRTTGSMLGPALGNAFVDFLLQLHTEIFLVFPEMVLLGEMGILPVVALISGVVLYARSCASYRSAASGRGQQASSPAESEHFSPHPRAGLVTRDHSQRRSHCLGRPATKN